MTGNTGTAFQEKQLLPVFMALFGIAVFVVASWVLVREIRSAGLAAIVSQFAAIPMLYVVAAAIFTALSYFLLTLHDALAFKYIGAKIAFTQIAPIAFSAFAVGHNVGVASLSGGAIRYRAYSLAGFTTTQIATIIAFIPLTFGVGVAFMLGIAFLVEPAGSLAAIPLGAFVLRVAGSILLLLVGVYLLALKLYRRPLQLASWRLQLPSVQIGVYQLIVACADLLAASLVLFVLLKASVDISYPVLLGAFLLSIVIGVISTVPGAIGVFESSMVLLLPNYPIQVLLGAMLAYRLIYYVMPLLLAVTLIAFREASEHRHRLQEISEKGLEWGTRIVPHTLGAAIFIAGALLLVRGSIPIELDRTKLVEITMPVQLLEMSHLLSSAIGVGLLIVARGLYRRLHRAWVATITMLVLAVAAAVVQSHGIVHVSFLVFLIMLIWVSRAEFYRGKQLIDQKFDSSWIKSISLVLIAALGIGLLAYQNTQYSHELWWQFTLNGEASRMMRALLLALLLLGMFALARFLRGSAVLTSGSSEGELELVKRLINSDDSSFANIALLGDKRFLLHPSGEAFLMYQVSGSSWIALSDPVGDTAHFEELLWQFREACDANNKRCVFYQVGSTYLSMYIDLGLSFLKLGEEGVVNLTTFDLEGHHRADLRQALSRARRSGAEFEVVPAAAVASIIDTLAKVSALWLAHKSTEEKGFSLGYFEPAYMLNFDCAVVKVNGEIVAFANLWKGGSGEELSLDLMRYTDAAPKGVMDYLFTQIMLWGKAQGYQKFSLGMAPLSGLESRDLATPWHKLGNLVYRFGENFYNFEGLRHYKDKFEPDWEPRFLACKGGLQVPAVLLDTTVLISGGYGGILSK